MLTTNTFKENTYDRSTEQDARTFASFGDHCKSSTEALCPSRGFSFTLHVPFPGVHMNIFFLQSPVAKAPMVINRVNFKTRYFTSN